MPKGDALSETIGLVAAVLIGLYFLIGAGIALAWPLWAWFVQSGSFC